MNFFSDEEEVNIMQWHTNHSIKNPADYVIVTSDVIKVWTESLLKGRKYMIELMHVSGQHGSDPMDFVETALSHAKIRKFFSPFCLFYFFIRAGDCTEFDKKFTGNLCQELIGDSTNLNEECTSAKKKDQE